MCMCCNYFGISHLLFDIFFNFHYTLVEKNNEFLLTLRGTCASSLSPEIIGRRYHKSLPTNCSDELRRRGWGAATKSLKRKRSFVLSRDIDIGRFISLTYITKLHLLTFFPRHILTIIKSLPRSSFCLAYVKWTRQSQPSNNQARCKAVGRKW